jgi:hypothetical protein
VTFWLSEETILRFTSKTKLEYVISLYEKTFLSTELETNIFLFCLLLPLVITIFNSRIVSPELGLWFYKKDCETSERRDRAKRRAAEMAEKEVAKEKLERLNIEDAAFTKERAVMEERKTQEERESEYKKFKENRTVYEHFYYVYKSLYDHNGRTNWAGFMMLTQAKAWLYTNEVMFRKPEAEGEVLELTNK